MLRTTIIVYNVLILFQPILGCPAYPVTHYVLLLQEIASEEMLVTLGPSVEPRFIVTSPFIRENSRFRYRLRAVNSVNLSSETEATEFCEFYEVHLIKNLISTQKLQSKLECACLYSHN